MATKFHHEQLFRGQRALERLSACFITICGAGAIGSNLAIGLARQGFTRLRLIDKDRVEEQNVSTQTYDEADVGAWKVEVLRNQIFRAVGVEAEIVSKELNERTVTKFLKGSDIVVDAFDNSQSRGIVQSHCRAHALSCLHVGLSADYGEVIWDQHYLVPSDAGLDVCDYPLARNMVLLASTVAAETILRRVLRDEVINRSITLSDFAIREFEIANAV